MSVLSIGSPFAVVFPSGNAITQLREISVDHNFQDADEQPAGQSSPFFTGSDAARPDVPFSSPQIADLLTLCAADGVANYFDGANEDTIVYFRAGKKGGLREDVDDTVHWKALMQENAFLYWNSIRASQDQTAEISFRVLPIYDGTNDPLVWSSGDALTGITSAVQHRFTLGPLKLNGSWLGGEQSVNWDNNIRCDEVSGGGAEFVEFASIDRLAPTIVCQTRNLDVLDAYGERGTDLTALSWFLRRRKQSGINYDNADSQHIKFTATAGTIKARKVAGTNGLAEVFIQLRKANMATNLFTIALSQAIS